MKSKLEKVYNELLYRKLIESQVDFAKKLGYTKSHFNQIMTGAQPVTKKLKAKIQTMFGIPTFYWLSDSIEDVPFDEELIGSPVGSDQQTNQDIDNMGMEKESSLFGKLKKFMRASSGKTLDELTIKDIEVLRKINDALDELEE